jgi:aminopeptidase YwaD
MPASVLNGAHKHGYTFGGWLLDGKLVTDAEFANSSVIGKTLYADFKLEYDEPLTAAEQAFLATLDYSHVDYLAHYISEDIGNRVLFSPRRDMCVDWIVSELTSYGYTPTIQEFNRVIDNTADLTPTINGLIWIGGKHYAYYGPVYAASSVYQYNSNADLTITGAAVVNWANQSNAFVLPSGDYTGKVVFVTMSTVGTAVAATMPSAANVYNAALALQNAGAAAVMFQTPPMAANGNTTYARLANTTSGTIITIPVGSTLNYETAGILSSLGATTEVKFNLFRNNVCKNVIAKIPAATPTNKTVYITSHHDTTSSGPGLNDDGSGVIMSLEMARAFKNVPFDYNIVFVFFDSEEGNSMAGSTNFCRSLVKSGENAGFVANYNMDMIATSQENCEWMFMNISDTRLQTMQSAIPTGNNNAMADNPAAVLVAKEYGIYNTTMKAAAKMGFTDYVLFCYDTTTDHVQFVRNGMPNAVEYDWRSNRRGTGFETLYHKAGDNYALNYSSARMKTQGDIISLAIYYAAQGQMPVSGVASIPWVPQAALQPLPTVVLDVAVEETVLEEVVEEIIE